LIGRSALDIAAIRADAAAMATDAELIEQTLLALAGREESLRDMVFARFFAAWPERRASFLTPAITARRMADETLQLLYGLALGEDWVWPHIADLVDLHRAYGRLATAEYDSFIALVVDEACALGGAGSEARAAWGRQETALGLLVSRASAEWERALPRHGGAGAA
jgi:hypothetical protein